MIVIEPDHGRRIEIPGIPGLVSRPVDVDRSQTGFSNLRSLRIYRFEAKSVVDGHAEEDEVFVVVMAGSVELAIRDSGRTQGDDAFTLSAPWGAEEVACIAYLQPGSAYRLTPQTDADVAYARATPSDGPPSAIFRSRWSKSSSQSGVLEQTGYARRLHLKLFYVDAVDDDVTFSPAGDSAHPREALINVRTAPEHAGYSIRNGTQTTQLKSWDSVAIAPGESPILCVGKRSQACALVVSAV